MLLIGLKAAGLAGALRVLRGDVRTLLRADGTSWRAYWHRDAARRLARGGGTRAGPGGVGLTFASGLALMRGTEHGWLPWAVTIASTALFSPTMITRSCCWPGRRLCCLLERDWPPYRTTWIAEG